MIHLLRIEQREYKELYRAEHPDCDPETGQPLFHALKHDRSARLLTLLSRRIAGE